MKRVFIFIGLKIAEIIGVVLAFSIFAGIFKICDMHFFDFFPFRDGYYYQSITREWLYCGMWGIITIGVIASVLIFIISGLMSWVESNWKWSGRIAHKTTDLEDKPEPV